MDKNLPDFAIWSHDEIQSTYEKKYLEMNWIFEQSSIVLIHNVKNEGIRGNSWKYLSFGLS